MACPTQQACFTTGAALYASGDGTNLTVAEKWNGDQWAIETSSNPSGATAHGLYCVSCASARACMAVGYYFDAAGTRVTLAEEWNDSTWVIRPTPNAANAIDAALWSVSCQSAQDCTAVGTSTDSTGLLSALAEHWNGRSWSVQPSPAGPPDILGSFLSGVSCTSRSACTAAAGYFDSTGMGHPRCQPVGSCVPGSTATSPGARRTTANIGFTTALR